ncbi:MarR family winged helix-turn-helix transcriptional regulator [Bailinhaonella thermotolerans]|uniref:MarR family winged helix-turn-helix transcriptional regulator n=1 Tax=Bailinhaonella thermotolerans TaxID=1070861 RepID=UPI001F5B6389|nr:MarR family transcriptional regulator [Bailinhaonella thermotolerans]
MAELVEAGREQSTATVMFHTAVSALMGLSPTDYKAMDLLERFGPLTAGELAEHAALAPASVSGLIDRLERRGMVRRTRDAADRRRVIVELTLAVGEASRYTIYGDLINGLNEIYATYTDEQLETVLDFLRRSAAVQREATARLPAELPEP